MSEKPDLNSEATATSQTYARLVEAAYRLRSAVNSYPFRAPELKAWSTEVIPALDELSAALEGLPE